MYDSSRLARLQYIAHQVENSMHQRAKEIQQYHLSYYIKGTSYFKYFHSNKANNFKIYSNFFLNAPFLQKLLDISNNIIRITVVIIIYCGILSTLISQKAPNYKYCRNFITLTKNYHLIPRKYSCMGSLML